jgi:hypothetical protein
MGSTMFAMVLVLGVGHHQPSYFEEKSAQVFASFLSFATARTVEEDQNRLQEHRDRDTLLLPGGRASLEAGAAGSMVMGAAVVLAAHAPKRMRAIVDGPVHVGPAMFEGGGMGAGVGGRF